MNSRSDTADILLATECLSLYVGARCLCHEINLHLHAGQCLVLLGPNGAGKTTLLHTLAGIRAANSGEVYLQGRPYTAWDWRAAARFRGFLPQQQTDYFSSSVLETVLIGRHPHMGRWRRESKQDKALAYAALERVGLSEMANRNILTLSGGERQRVAIAALLTQTPQLFLFDEPLNHLDLHYQIATLDLFNQLAREGKAIVMVLHDINLAARYADHIVLFDGFGNVEVGPREKIMQADKLSNAFGHSLYCHEINKNAVFLPE